MRRRFIPRLSISFLFYTVLISSFSEIVSSAMVTLDSIEIYTTHEWKYSKPEIYFRCKGENKTMLPDVKEKHVLYTFKGEESWQPLTQLQNKKCKRCGIYEQDKINSDDVFDEWEFCPSDFTTSDGKYSKITEKEFNATFLCLECVPLVNNTTTTNTTSAAPQKPGPTTHWTTIALIAGITLIVSTIFIIGLVFGCKYLKERKRKQEQARFLKLFEDDDDIEDELGIGPLSSSI